MRKVYQEIAAILGAIENCRKSGNKFWLGRWGEKLSAIMKDAPSGSGIDCGTRLMDGASTPEKLVFFVEYHHMNEDGFYDGWTQHKVIVRPSLQFDFNLSITGRDRNQIKDYLADVYDGWLREDYKEQEEKETKK